MPATTKTRFDSVGMDVDFGLAFDVHRNRFISDG